ncbi:hypothetical protein U3516DRAFT_823746 [Neocallimastix sp. 'constans']
MNSLKINAFDVYCHKKIIEKEFYEKSFKRIINFNVFEKLYSKWESEKNERNDTFNFYNNIALNENNYHSRYFEYLNKFPFMKGEIQVKNENSDNDQHQKSPLFPFQNSSNTTFVKMEENHNLPPSPSFHKNSEYSHHIDICILSCLRSVWENIMLLYNLGIDATFEYTPSKKINSNDKNNSLIYFDIYINTIKKFYKNSINTNLTKEYDSYYHDTNTTPSQSNSSSNNNNNNNNNNNANEVVITPKNEHEMNNNFGNNSHYSNTNNNSVQSTITPVSSTSSPYNDFKRLRQNKQKQLIIRMCRKLMEDAKITGYSSVPWKQLSTGRCPFIFENWPHTIPDKPLAPGYPTKNDPEPYEPVPFEDISWLGTNQRKTLFMALKSGAIFVRYRYPNEFPTTIVNENILIQSQISKKEKIHYLKK